jgi:C-terminal peptidase prc
MNRSTFVAASLAAFLTWPGFGLAQQEGELSALVASEVRAAPERSLEELWRRAVELREAEALGEAGELDRRLDEWIVRRAELPPSALLFAVAARLPGAAPDPSRLAEALAPLVESPEVELAAAAAELLAAGTFKTLSPSRRDALANAMLERAKDKALPPSARLAFAKSAFQNGGGKERLKANQVLRSFLESRDPELRAEGALASAELEAIVIDGDLRAILEDLARIPDARGALAKSYLKNEDLRRANERTRDDLLKRFKDGSAPPEMRQFLAVLGLIQNYHLEGRTVQQEKLFDAAINGMLGYMDQHSNLLPSELYAKFYGELEAEYGGIGAYVNEDQDDGLFTIVRPIYSGPAYQQGLMTDDKIVRIDDWPTLGQPVDTIIKHLKGKPKTSVELYIWRHGMDPGLIERPSEDMRVHVVREQVRIPPGTFQMLPGDIGLLQLDDFSQVAKEEAKKWIEELRRLGMKALVLDLRFNGGGLLPEAQRVAELFLPKGLDVVSTQGPDPESKQTLKTRAQPTLPAEMPLVVLVGGGTASAAEIVSGALQDHGRAKLVGKTTYGKGSVQQLIKVPGQPEDEWVDENQNQMRDPWEEITKDHDEDGEMDYAPRVKLTVAEYLLPSGRSIHRKIDREGHVISEGGVEPDVEIDPPLIEGWRVQEQRRIRPQVKKHVEETYAANRELYNALALNDQKRADLYPGFEELLQSLETSLPREDVRRWLRYEVRRRVQDDRGAAFPLGDFVEDVQLQKAIQLALEGLGKTPEDVDDFGLVFDLPEPKTSPTLTLARGEGSELSRALQESRRDGKPLTKEQLDRLIEILGTIDLKKN